MDYQSLQELIPRRSSEWSQTDVSKWLEFICLQKYVPVFQRFSIDGSCLKLLNQNDLLNEMGISSKVICKKLLNWIIFGLQEFNRGFYDTGESSKGELSQNLQPTQVYERDELTCYNDGFQMKRSVKKKEYESVLILKKAEGKQNVFHKFKERDCRIGKDANCEINITGEGIEPFHVHISYRNGDFYLRSLSALEVTFIKVDSRVAIYHGMKVEMGSNIFKLTFEPTMGLKTEIVEGKNVGEVFQFPTTKGKVSIGRKVSNDINFPRDTTLSNLHSKITYTNFGWFIEDLMTTNGTWMEAEKEIKISSGMVFKLGTTNYQFSCELLKVKSNENQEQSIVMMKKQTFSCLVCQEQPRQVLLLPCSHCVACEKCSKNLSFCLICLQRFTSTTKIFRT